MTSFITRMPAGIVGAISRFDTSLQVEQGLIDTANPPVRYGSVVKLNGSLIGAMASGDAAGVVYAWAVRPFPVQSTTNSLGVAVPPSSGVIDVLRRGYMSVKCAVGTPAKNGQVYVVITAGGSVVVGDIVTAASPAGGGAAVAVAGAIFMGPADANGITEIHQKY